ncbi:phage terminase small subunit [Alicyclobacillus herbarius]|uniref:phage terminase small subunit n=1 Tax=Alicyclobacillus herbarius TaxID=122960 RepID=UPI0006868E1E|nr:phage terminase small subunit [Alicyclobacillus herbarius]
MPRQRSPERDRAFQMWRESGGKMKLKDIAKALGVLDTQVRKWKNQDRWNVRLNSNVTELKSNVTKRPGAPRGNRNAVGNRGGPGGPPGNKKAVVTGEY